MKAGWEVKTLGDVCEEIFAGGDVPKNSFSKIETDEFKIPIYANGEKNKGLFGYTNKPRISKPSITISARGTIGYSETRTQPFYPVVRLIVITPKKEILDLSFLQFVINGIDFTHSGTSIPQLTVPMVKEYKIPIPPLPEQQRIVALLDAAFASIATAKANTEQNLKNAHALFDSYLHEVFSKRGEDWEEKTLGDVLLKTETVDPTKKPNNEFIYLDVSSVNKETKEIENPTVLLGKNAPSRARKLVKTNDVIFATVRPTHSRVALITEEYNEQVCSTGYFVLRAKKFINHNLIFYFLLTKNFNKQMELLQKGASYPAVTDNEVKGVYINFPKSKNEQEIIVNKLNELKIETQRLETLYQRKLQALDELKKSLLHKAFNGEL